MAGNNQYSVFIDVKHQRVHRSVLVPVPLWVHSYWFDRYNGGANTGKTGGMQLKLLINRYWHGWLTFSSMVHIGVFQWFKALPVTIGSKFDGGNEAVILECSKSQWGDQSLIECYRQKYNMNLYHLRWFLSPLNNPFMAKRWYSPFFFVIDVFSVSFTLLTTTRSYWKPMQY